MSMLQSKIDTCFVKLIKKIESIDVPIYSSLIVYCLMTQLKMILIIEEQTRFITENHVTGSI